MEKSQKIHIKEISKFEKVLLVYGGGIKEMEFTNKSKMSWKILKSLLSGVEPNPRVSTARKGIEIRKKK